MAEQRIVITIDDFGKIQASTDGIKGEMCLKELEELLEEEVIDSVKKTDEYYQKAENKVTNIQQIKKK